MNLRKIIVYFFLGVIFFTSLHRVLINIYYLSSNNFESGTIYKVDVFSDVDGYNSMRAFYLKNHNGKQYDGVYSEKDDFFLKKGDTIVFRKLFNGSVRVIEKNNKKIQSYYGFWDYGSIISLISIVFGYIYIPKLIKKMKENDN